MRVCAYTSRIVYHCTRLGLPCAPCAWLEQTLRSARELTSISIQRLVLQTKRLNPCAPMFSLTLCSLLPHPSVAARDTHA